MMTEDQFMTAIEQAREDFAADNDAPAFRARLLRLGFTMAEIDAEIEEVAALQDWVE